MAKNMHFWIIFYRARKDWGWRAYESVSGYDDYDVIAYPTRKVAQQQLAIARKTYGEARLYKFYSEAYIFGASTGEEMNG